MGIGNPFAQAVQLLFRETEKGRRVRGREEKRDAGRERERDKEREREG